VAKSTADQVDQRVKDRSIDPVAFSASI